MKINHYLHYAAFAIDSTPPYSTVAIALFNGQAYDIYDGDTFGMKVEPTLLVGNVERVDLDDKLKSICAERGVQ